jgi:hypothetical protein
MKILYLGVILLIAILGTAFITYNFFPKIETEKEYITEIIEVEKPVEHIIYIEKPVIKYLKTSTQTHLPEQEPHISYIENVNGTLKEAGSTYTNKPSNCAKLHNRSLC